MPKNDSLKSMYPDIFGLAYTVPERGPPELFKKRWFYNKMTGHQEPPGAARIHHEPPGATRSHQESREAARIHQ